MNKFLIELNKYVQDDDIPVVRGLISEAIEEIIGELEREPLSGTNADKKRLGRNQLRAEQTAKLKEFLNNE